MSQMNGKVLDIREDDTQPGAKVIMYDRKVKDADNQLWFEDERGNLRSRLNGLILDTSSGIYIYNIYIIYLCIYMYIYQLISRIFIIDH